MNKRELFEKRNPMKNLYEVDEVMFINFPMSIRNDEVLIDVRIYELAREVAKQIPDTLKKSITVDFDRLSVWDMIGEDPNENVDMGPATQELLSLMSE